MSDDWISKYEREAEGGRQREEEYKRKRAYQLERLRESGLPNKIKQIYERLARAGKELHYKEKTGDITVDSPLDHRGNFIDPIRWT